MQFVSRPSVTKNLKPGKSMHRAGALQNNIPIPIPLELFVHMFNGYPSSEACRIYNNKNKKKSFSFVIVYFTHDNRRNIEPSPMFNHKLYMDCWPTALINEGMEQKRYNCQYASVSANDQQTQSTHHCTPCSYHCSTCLPTTLAEQKCNFLHISYYTLGVWRVIRWLFCQMGFTK